MSTISRTIFTFEVLHRTDQPCTELDEALERASDGHAVGMVTSEKTVEVPDTEVPETLIDFGSDGEFFDDDLGVGTETYTVVIDEKNWDN
jgi:hypothetical protein